MPVLEKGEEAPASRLTALVASVWSPLVPPLDEASLRLLKVYALLDRPISLYRAAKLADMSFSLAYKKGSALRGLRLLDTVDGSNYHITVKGCIAALSRAGFTHGEFLRCIRRVWPISSGDLSDEELLSFLYVLGIVMARRGLDITKATICGFDESSIQVFKVYLNDVVARVLLGRRVTEAVEDLARRWGVEPRIILNALRAAIKGVLSFIPPTLVTESHKILATLNGGAPRPIAVVCNRRGCMYYEETLGLTCPSISRELSRAVHGRAYANDAADDTG